jgi:hypothetical protein
MDLLLVVVASSARSSGSAHAPAQREVRTRRRSLTIHDPMKPPALVTHTMTAMGGGEHALEGLAHGPSVNAAHVSSATW